MDDKDQLYRSIGMYVYWFSRLDAIVHLVAQKLLGLSTEQFNCVMPVIDFVSACNICKAQIPTKLEAAKAKRGLKLIDDALAVNGDRTRVVHGLWFYTEGSHAIHASKGKLEHAAYFEQPGELTSKALKLEELSHEIFRLFDPWSVYSSDVR